MLYAKTRAGGLITLLVLVACVFTGLARPQEVQAAKSRRHRGFEAEAGVFLRFEWLWGGAVGPRRPLAARREKAVEPERSTTTREVDLVALGQGLEGIKAGIERIGERLEPLGRTADSLAQLKDELHRIGDALEGIDRKLAEGERSDRTSDRGEPDGEYAAPTGRPGPHAGNFLTLIVRGGAVAFDPCLAWWVAGEVGFRWVDNKTHLGPEVALAGGVWGIGNDDVLARLVTGVGVLRIGAVAMWENIGVRAGVEGWIFYPKVKGARPDMAVTIGLGFEAGDGGFLFRGGIFFSPWTSEPAFRGLGTELGVGGAIPLYL